MRLVVAGRTDAGVHATGQVAHADIEWPVDAAQSLHDLPRIFRVLRYLLGQESDIFIRSVTEAPAGFDARFSAVGRRYVYRIQDDESRTNPLERLRTVSWPRALELEAMNAAASTLLGLRDFGAFCKPRPGATTIRDLQEFSWSRDDAGTLIATLQADAFCHSMVRALVGACVTAGQGRLDLDELTTLRDAAERTSRFRVMPAHGLCLTEVIYPPEDQLAARAELTRGKRDLPGD